MDQLVVRPIRIEGEARFQRWRLGFTNLTADFQIVGRLCQTPWRFTETPYNVRR
jgi:hypothetical protein